MGSRFSIEAERDSLKAQVGAFKVRCEELVSERDAAEALARESGRQVVDGISAMLTIANQRDAANSELVIQREDLRRLHRLNDRRREVEEKLAEVTTERDAAIRERDEALALIHRDSAHQMVAIYERALFDIARGDYSDPLRMKTPEQRARDALELGRRQ